MRAMLDGQTKAGTTLAVSSATCAKARAHVLMYHGSRRAPPIRCEGPLGVSALRARHEPVFLKASDQARPPAARPVQSRLGPCDSTCDLWLQSPRDFRSPTSGLVQMTSSKKLFTR